MPAGRPSKRTASVEQRIFEGLSAGTPLTVICAADDMPDDDTVRRWAEGDEAFSRAIARAREAGFDQIALDALTIADDRSQDTKIVGEEGREVPDTEWISRSKLRVETRLKLLSKWDPKRYGDAVQVKHADADGEKLERDPTAVAIRAAAMIAAALSRGADAAD